MVLDNFRTIELIWDKANKSIIKTIKTASSDTTGRYFSVKILDGGQEATLSNAKLQLYWEHPNFNTSGTDDFNTVNNGGLFKMTFSDEMLTNIGELNAHLVLTLSDGKITSDGFTIEVTKGADSGVVVPTNGNGLVKQIDGKIDKGNVTLNDLTQEVKLAMTGGSVAVVGENAVGAEHIKDNTVKTSKIGSGEVTGQTTSFIKSSSNLLDRESLLLGSISSDGSISDNTLNFYSHRIDVLPGQILFTRNVSVLSWYNQSDVFTGRTAVESANVASAFTTVPENVYYVRGNIQKSRYDDPGTFPLQISISDIEIPYEKYYQKLTGVEVESDDIKGQLGTSSLKNGSITEQKVDFIKNSSNLLNRENLFRGAILADGSISERTDYFYSHKIDVVPGQTLFTRHINNLAYYGQNDEFVSRYAIPVAEVLGAFTVVPTDVYSVRANIQKVRYDMPSVYDLQLSVSDSEIPYEPYYITIDNLQYPTPRLLNFKTDDLYVINGKIDGVYQNSVQLDGYENVETDWLPDKIYQKFDELMNNYPNYVTKQTMGKDSSGLFDINMYRFKPQSVPTSNQTKRPKMILMAGNHGYEKTHPYVLYLVMKKLCEEWRTDELLETLRWNVDFIIIPCSNPSSFESRSRTNSNGVDISRNFEADWEISGDANKGSAPLSEPESQYIDTILKEHHEDAIFFTSLHNFSSSTDPEATANRPNEFIWVPAADKLQEHISQELVSRMSRLWKRKYEWIPQDEDLYLGYVDRQTPYGLEGLQANLYGISASTYEISRIFQLEENPVNSNGQVITMGVEGLVNMLLLNLKVGVDYYNINKKVVKE